MSNRLTALPIEHNRGLFAIPSELSAAPPNLDYVKSAGYLVAINWPFQSAWRRGRAEQGRAIHPAGSIGKTALYSAYGTPATAPRLGLVPWMNLGNEKRHVESHWLLLVGYVVLLVFSWFSGLG